MPIADEALTLLARIADDLHALRQIAESSRRPAGVLRHQDQAALKKILPVLAANFEGSFGVWEIFDSAQQADMLGANLRLVLAGQMPQRLGKLFARGAGHNVDGLKLCRQGHDGNGALWECVAVPSS